MSTQSTVPTQLERLMAALSVAERLTAESPATPTSVTVTDTMHFGYVPGTFEPQIGVVLYFHGAPASVRSFAEVVGGEIAQDPLQDDVYTHADGVVDGVPFRAWSLTAAETPAVAA